MKKILVFFAFLLVGKFNYAQYLNYTLYELLHKEDMKASPVAFDNQYSGILGNGFFTESWLTGRAYTSMKVYNNLKLKFDVYANKIYINNHDTIFDITNAGIIQFDLFINENDTTKYKSFVNGYNFNEVKPAKFVELLADGKITFLQYHLKSMEEVYETSPYDKQKKFLDKNKYFILTDGKDAMEVSITRKNLEKILAPKWDEVSKYLKSQSLNTNNEEGWKKAITYYNNLP